MLVDSEKLKALIRLEIAAHEKQTVDKFPALTIFNLKTGHSNDDLIKGLQIALQKIEELGIEECRHEFILVCEYNCGGGACTSHPQKAACWKCYYEP